MREQLWVTDPLAWLLCSEFGHEWDIVERTYVEHADHGNATLTYAFGSPQTFAVSRVLRWRDNPAHFGELGPVTTRVKGCRRCLVVDTEA